MLNTLRRLRWFDGCSDCAGRRIVNPGAFIYHSAALTRHIGLKYVSGFQF